MVTRPKKTPNFVHTLFVQRERCTVSVTYTTMILTTQTRGRVQHIFRTTKAHFKIIFLGFFHRDQDEVLQSGVCQNLFNAAVVIQVVLSIGFFFETISE